MMANREYVLSGKSNTNSMNIEKARAILHEVIKWGEISVGIVKLIDRGISTENAPSKTEDPVRERNPINNVMDLKRGGEKRQLLKSKSTL